MKIKILEFILEFVGEVSRLVLLSAGCVISSLSLSLSLSLSCISLSEIFQVIRIEAYILVCVSRAARVFCFLKIL